MLVIIPPSPGRQHHLHARSSRFQPLRRQIENMDKVHLTRYAPGLGLAYSVTLASQGPARRYPAPLSAREAGSVLRPEGHVSSRSYATGLPGTFGFTYTILFCAIYLPLLFFPYNFSFLACCWIDEVFFITSSAFFSYIDLEVMNSILHFQWLSLIFILFSY